MNLVMQTFGRIVTPLFGTGVGRIPGVVKVYKWVWNNFAPKGIIKTQANGCEININAKDWAIVPSLLFTHQWEKVETELVKEYVKEGMTVLDVGAHVGYYTVLMSKLVGKGKVYSFEPSPETQALFKMNVLANKLKNVTLYPCAVSNVNGKSTMWYDSSPASNSLWSKDKKRSFNVDLVTIDSLIKEPVDFIKMDIEGGEVRALQGMQNLIKNSPNLIMLVEVHPGALSLAGVTLKQYLDLLNDFKWYLLDGTETTIHSIEKEIRKAGSINLLCVKGDL